MNFNWTLSLLVHKGLITVEEAEHLAKRLMNSLHPQDFTEAHKKVEAILGELEKHKSF